MQCVLYNTIYDIKITVEKKKNNNKLLVYCIKKKNWFVKNGSKL